MMNYLSGVWTKPFVLHQYTSILQNSPDFVYDDLHLDQQPAVPSTYGESKRAIEPHIKSWIFKWLDNTTSKCPASVWSQTVSLIRLPKSGPRMDLTIKQRICESFTVKCYTIL